MDTTTIIEIISTLGFPIALVIVLCWFIYKIYKKSEEREATLMEEIKENRVVNTKFAEIIAKYEITLDEMKTDIREIKDTLQISND
jgi:F0F1-type ATP synthase membrane subunit b/b'